VLVAKFEAPHVVGEVLFLGPDLVNGLAKGTIEVNGDRAGSHAVDSLAIVDRDVTNEFDETGIDLS
jgi:hypothetical protein